MIYIVNNSRMLQKQWQPLGLDSWRANGGYFRALDEIDAQLDHFEIIDKHYCKEMGAVALRSNLAHQAERNGHKHMLVPETDERHDAAREGTIGPSDMVRLLAEYPDLRSAELARLTHVGEWDTNTLIDTPVRHELLDAEDLGTVSTEDASYYTINALSSEHPNEIGIGRKRVVYQHFGGEVLTVITNNLLVDLSDKTSLDREFRKDLRAYVQAQKDFNYSDHHNFLRNSLESQLRNPDASTKASGIIPLSTIYYATLADARTKAAIREESQVD